MALFRKKRNDDAVDPNDRSPESGVRYKDLAVLGQLLEYGVDMSKPRQVLYYLYFPTHDAASAAAADAVAGGFSAEAKEPLPGYPDQWRVVAEMPSVVLDLPTVRGHGDLFDGLAATHGGEYDGWEASV